MIEKILEAPKNNNAKIWQIFAKKVAEEIKQDCKLWIKESEGKPAYRGMRAASYMSDYKNLNANIDSGLIFTKKTRKDRRPKDLTDELTQAINETMKVIGSDVRRENSVFVSGEEKMAKNYGDVFVIFPIGDYEFAWSDIIGDPEDLSILDYSDVNKKEVDDWLEERREIITRQKEREVERDIREDLLDKWRDYFFGKAEEYYNNLADTDPEKYTTDEESLVRKWLHHYKDDFEDKVQELTAQKMMSEDVIDEIELEIKLDLEDNNLTPHDDSYDIIDIGKPVNHDFFTFSEDVFVNKFAGSYFTEDLAKGLDYGHEIMVKCEKYYAVDHDFFQIFLKDELWR